MYEDAAQHYHDVLNGGTIEADDRLRLFGKLAEALSYTKDPSIAEIWHNRFLNIYYKHFRGQDIAAEPFLRFARHLWIMSKSKEQLTLLTREAAWAKIHGSRLFFAKTLIQKATVLTRLARHYEAQKCLEEIHFIDKLNADTRVRYWREKGMVEAELGRGEASLACCDSALSAADDASDVSCATIAWEGFGVAAMILGKTKLSKDCFERALLHARKNNVPRMVAYQCLHYADTLKKMGQISLANEYLNDAISCEVKASSLDAVLAAYGIPIALQAGNEVALAKCARVEVIDQSFESGESARIAAIVSAFAQFYVWKGNVKQAQRLLHRALVALNRIEYSWDLVLGIAQHGYVTDIPQTRRLLERRIKLTKSAVVGAYLPLFDAFVDLREKRFEQGYAQARKAASCFNALQWYGYADLARSLLPKEQRAPKIVRSEEKPFSEMNARLTDREREVAALMLRGLSNRAIADALEIKERTVETHMTSIMSRLGVRSRYQLIEQFTSAEP